jgi:Family of unknown function (DUF5946)
MDQLVKCYGCGALVKHIPGKPHKYIGAVAGCWEIYGEILAKEYGDYGYPQLTHRLTVDTYAVQHPGESNRQAIQSVNGHLFGLYLVLEKHISGQHATEALATVLNHADRFVWLEPPQPNGRLTVIDVVKATNFEDHQRLVEQWASDVWAAWARHHDTIRKLGAQYLN